MQDVQQQTYFDKQKQDHFKKLREKRAFLKLVFNDIDAIDPDGLHLGIETPERQPPDQTSLIKKLPMHADRHYVFDIETFGSDPSLLDFAMMCDINGNLIEHEGSDVIADWESLCRAIENLIPKGNNPETGRGWVIKLWAHNGAKFDFAGLAKMVQSDIVMKKAMVEEEAPDALERRCADIKQRITHLSDMLLRKRLEEVLSLDTFDAMTAALIGIANDYRHDFFEYEQIMALAGMRYTIKVERHVPRSGIFRGARPLIRSGHGRTKHEWKIVPMGDSYAIKIKRGNSKLFIVDSLKMIQSRIADMGAKGITPERNINPRRWLLDEFLCGNLEYDPRFFPHEAFEYWKQSRSESDEEYCRDDVRILANALSEFGEVFRSLMPSHPQLDTIEALDFNTITQLGAFLRNIIFTHDQRKAMANRNNPHQVYYQKQGYDASGRKIQSLRPKLVMKDVDSVNQQLLAIQQKVEKGAKIPYQVWDYPIFEEGKQNFYSFQVFYQNGKTMHAYNRCTYGGSTVVYQPNTPDGYRIMRLDVTNMYGSIQALPEYPFVYPERLKPLGAFHKKGLYGKDNILAYINHPNGKPKLGGVVEVVINRLICNKGVDFHKFPLIPGHMNATDYHEQTVFADHNDRYRRVMLVEELRYILENADVANDDVMILPATSYLAEYMPYKPTEHFINKIFNIRAKAREAGEDFKVKLYKMVQNASYGEMLQTITMTIDLNSSDIDGILAAISELKLHNPFWVRWADVDRDIANRPLMDPDHPDYDNAMSFYALTLMNHINLFLTDNWIDLNAHIYVDENGDNRMVYRLPSGIATHAIKAWGSAIPAYGRIMLHKACVMANRAGFEVAYTDTDCIDLLVPVEISDEDALARLTAQGLKIGKNLGEWEYQPFYADKEMLVAGADVTPEGDDFKINNPRIVYLAAKHYAIYDQYMNALKITVKGIKGDSYKERAAGAAIILSRYNAKSRSGVATAVNALHYTDSISSVHEYPKRNYPGMYEYSTAIQLDKLTPNQIRVATPRKIVRKGKALFAVDARDGEFIPVWEDYIREIRTVHADNRGLIEAREFYCNNLYFKRKHHHELMAEIEAVKKMHRKLKERPYLSHITADDFNTEVHRLIEFTRGYEPDTDVIIERINTIFQDVRL